MPLRGAPDGIVSEAVRGWPRDLTNALFALGVFNVAAQVWYTWAGLVATPSRPTDFSLMYLTASRALRGLQLYTPGLRPGEPLANFNPPHFHILLFPFAKLSEPAAFLAWTALNLAALVTLAAIIRGDVGRTSIDWRAAAGVALLSMPIAISFKLGQVSLLLALLIGLAWREAHHGRSIHAAAWLGAAISLKPFLLLFLPVWILQRRFGATAVSVVTAVVAAAIGAVVFGPAAVLDWIAALREPHAFTHTHNLSVIGTALRNGWPMTAGLIGAAAIGVVTCVIAGRAHGDVDGTFVLVIVGALLASPLGWTYYLVLAMAPVAGLIASKRVGRVWYVLLVALLLPAVGRTYGQESGWRAATAGSFYAWVGLLAWVLTAATVLRRRTVAACR